MERKHVIVGNGPWGLWFGQIEATDAEIVAGRSVRVYNARNIRYWYGRKGGIASLAAFGPCGPRMHESRIGAPIESTLLLDVKAIHTCAPEAVEAFSKIATHDA